MANILDSWVPSPLIADVWVATSKVQALLRGSIDPYGWMFRGESGRNLSAW